MTPEQQIDLGYTVQQAIQTYTDVETGELFFSADYEAIGAYVDSLLAAKDREIEALKARQITPEMAALYAEHRAELDDDFYPLTLAALKEALWVEFMRVMEINHE